MSPTLLWVTALLALSQPPLIFGTVCRVEDGMEWSCREAGECRSPEESRGNSHGVCPGNQTCCPPRHSSERLLTHSNYTANSYCEKLVETCRPNVSAEIHRQSTEAIFRLEKVGVESTKPGDLPFAALIGYYDRGNKSTWACVGALISLNYVLTSAHCIYHWKWRQREGLFVRLGDKTELRVSKRWVHPKYRGDSFNDLALLELEAPAALSPTVRPACLYTFPVIPYYRVEAAGWIRTGHGDEWGLVKADMFMSMRWQCLPPKLQVRREQSARLTVCATPVLGNEKVCQGDAVGPLVVRVGGRCTYSLLGISSAIPSCRLSFSPRLFAKVSNYIHWIERIVWPSYLT